jgi:hypothetical protein
MDNESARTTPRGRCENKVKRGLERIYRSTAVKSKMCVRENASWAM